MSRETFRFTSRTTRQRGGVGFNSDTRDNNRLEEMGCTVSTKTPLQPGELRKWSKSQGQGQRLNFFAVTATCNHCGKASAVNFVHLCGKCAASELRGEKVDADLEAEIKALQAEAKASLRRR